MSDEDVEWLKGTPFSQWFKKLEELEKKLDYEVTFLKEFDEAHEHHSWNERIEVLEKLSERNRLRVDELKEYRHNWVTPRYIKVQNAIAELKERYEEPWFFHRDKDGKKILTHIPNMFENIGTNREILREFFIDLEDYFGHKDHKKMKKKIKKYIKKLEGRKK